MTNDFSASIWIILLGLASPIYHYAEVARTECTDNQTDCTDNQTDCIESHRCNMNFVKYKNISYLMMEDNYRPFCQGDIIFDRSNMQNRKYQIQTWLHRCWK